MMKRKTFIFWLFVVITLSGCASPGWKSSPRAELMVAEKAYQGLVMSLTDLYKADIINDDDFEVIKVTARKTNELLQKWSDYTIETGKRPDVADAVLYFLEELATWELKTQQ